MRKPDTDPLFWDKVLENDSTELSQDQGEKSLFTFHLEDDPKECFISSRYLCASAIFNS